jgi:hypothetical protein
MAHLLAQLSGVEDAISTKKQVLEWMETPSRGLTNRSSLESKNKERMSSSWWRRIENQPGGIILSLQARADKNRETQAGAALVEGGWFHLHLPSVGR